MMTQYTRGMYAQRKVRDDLVVNGYRVVTAAGSKGVADLVAFKPGQALLVQVKNTIGPLPPRERAGLVALARFANGRSVWALPIAAAAPPKRPIVYRLLTGVGPADFELWTPDEVGAA
jgi:Holliday junction resolvase